MINKEKSEKPSHPNRKIIGNAESSEFVAHQAEKTAVGGREIN